MSDNKAVDEKEFFEEHMGDILKTQLLIDKLTLPNGKMECAAEMREEEVPVPALTRLQWDGHAGGGVKCHEEATKRWQEHSVYGEAFQNLTARLENVKLAQSTKGGKDPITGVKRQLPEEEKTPVGVKRMKQETETTARDNASQLPSSPPLIQINITPQVDLVVFAGPQIFLVHTKQEGEEEQFPAGKEMLGFSGTGLWWQKAGAKKDEEVMEKDIRFVLEDSNSMVTLQQVYNTVGDVVNVVREADPTKGIVQYHKLEAEPREGYPGFFKLTPKYSIFWRMPDYKATEGEEGKTVKRAHGASILPVCAWNTSHTELVWHTRWGRSGLQPMRPCIVFSEKITMAPGKVLELKIKPILP